MAFQFTDGVLSRWNFGLRGVLYWTRLTPIPSHASCYTQILTLKCDKLHDQTRRSNVDRCKSKIPSHGHVRDPTGPGQTCPRLRSGLRQSLVRVKFHYADPRTLSATRPDRTHGRSSYMSRFSGEREKSTTRRSPRMCRRLKRSGLVGSV